MVVRPCFSSETPLSILGVRSRSADGGTVEPVYNSHPRDFEKWPLNTGRPKILHEGRLGRGQISPTPHSRKE